jgi:hypothetical protein
MIFFREDCKRVGKHEVDSEGSVVEELVVVSIVYETNGSTWGSEVKE